MPDQKLFSAISVFTIRLRAFPLKHSRPVAVLAFIHMNAFEMRSFDFIDIVPVLYQPAHKQVEHTGLKSFPFLDIFRIFHYGSKC